MLMANTFQTIRMNSPMGQGLNSLWKIFAFCLKYAQNLCKTFLNLDGYFTNLKAHFFLEFTIPLSKL